MKTTFSLFVAALVVFGLVSVSAPTPVQASAGWCTAQERLDCEADCSAATPAECVYVSGGCYYDSVNNHALCGCNYACLISPHRPGDTGFKHLEVIHEYN